MTDTNLIAARVEAMSTKTLSEGSHESPDDGMCVMEAVAWVFGEPFSDHPKCACPVIAAFLRSWNDSLPDADRNAWLKPMIVRLVNTKSTAAVETKRATMAADWLTRVYTPAWLAVAGLNDQAASLESLSEITDFAVFPSLMPVINAARDAAKDAAWAAAGDAAGAAARAAAKDAAWDAARAAAWAAAGDAARAAAWAAAWDAAGDAAWAAAWDAAGDALAPTVAALQASALDLVDRMIDVRETEHA